MLMPPSPRPCSLVSPDIQHDPTTKPGIVEMSERVQVDMAHTDPQPSPPPTDEPGGGCVRSLRCPWQRVRADGVGGLGEPRQPVGQEGAQCGGDRSPWVVAPTAYNIAL